MIPEACRWMPPARPPERGRRGDPPHKVPAGRAAIAAHRRGDASIGRRAGPEHAHPDLQRSASVCGAEFIITTAKDAVRIPSPFRNALTVAEIEIDFGVERESFCRLAMSGLGIRSNQ